MFETSPELAKRLGIKLVTLLGWFRCHRDLAKLCDYDPSVEQAPKRRTSKKVFSEEELDEIKEQIRLIAVTIPSVSKAELSQKIGIKCNALTRILNQNKDLLHMFSFSAEESTAPRELATYYQVNTAEEMDSLRERIRHLFENNPSITRNDLAIELGMTKQRLMQYFRQDEDLAKIVSYKRVETVAPRRIAGDEKEMLKQQVRDMLEVSPNLTRQEIADKLNVNR